MQAEARVSIHRYRVCGLDLVSDLPLSGLPPVGSQPAENDVQVRFLRQGEVPPVPERWLMEWKLPAGEAWMAVAPMEHGYFLRLHGLADFFLDATGRRIDCLHKTDISRETLRHLLLDHLFPLALVQQGRDALHATAVLTPGGACIFTGPAGAGKSTVAASFLVDGYPVLSDDCLVLEERNGQVLAVPAYPEVRLWEDSLQALCPDRISSIPEGQGTSGKRRITSQEQVASFPAMPQPVARIYVLAERNLATDPGERTRPILEPMRGRESFLALLDGLFRLDVTDRAMLSRQFHFLGRLVDSIPIRRLSIPNDYALLPAVRQAIWDDLAMAPEATAGRCLTEVVSP